MKKRGQANVGMPIGMIFSLFLIAVFLVIAFIAVKSFLGTGRLSEIGIFYNDLQDTVDKAWQGQSGSKHFQINLPSGIEKVCFADLNNPVITPGQDYEHLRDFEVYDANVFLIPPQKAEGFEWHLIERINITTITETRNPYCVDVEEGLTIKKGFYDKYITIE